MKPANVKVRPDGLVKVLDFRLAKALDRDSGLGSDDLAELPVLNDGGRSTDDDAAAAAMIVAQNWFTELRRQVPTP